MKVRNINGTSQNTCKCGSWLDHWTKFSGKSLPQNCYEIKCTQKPEVGAHVQKETTDNNWYIIPLCKKHNGLHGETIDVVSTVTFVSANVSDTCG